MDQSPATTALQFVPRLLRLESLSSCTVSLYVGMLFFPGCSAYHEGAGESHMAMRAASSVEMTLCAKTLPNGYCGLRMYRCGSAAQH